MLNVVMLSVVVLNVVMRSVIYNPFILIDIILSVVMPNAAAPRDFEIGKRKKNCGVIINFADWASTR